MKNVIEICFDKLYYNQKLKNKFKFFYEIKN